MKSIKHLNHKGISLIEVMIAMVILSVSLLLLLNMAMVALDGNDWSNKMTVATQLLQEKMEQLRSNPTVTSGSDTSNGVVYSWTVSSAGSHLRRVDVSAVWKDIRSQERSNTITAYFKSDSV